MAFYKVSAKYKKSTLEKETWVSNENPHKFFHKTVGWRSGSFIVSLSEDEFEDAKEHSDDDEFFPYECRYSELIGCDDGCWEDFEYSDNFTDEEREVVENAWAENGYDGLEELGYFNSETDIILIGPLELELQEGDDSEYEADETSDSESLGSFTTLAATLAKAK